MELGLDADSPTASYRVWPVSPNRSVLDRLVIVTRTPFRVTLGGDGGTDLPSLYEQHGGFVLAIGLDVVLSIPNADVHDLQHELAREAFRLQGIHASVDVASCVDLPARYGPTCDDHRHGEESVLGIKEIGYRIRDALMQHDDGQIGRLMDAHWELKRWMSAKMSLSKIDELCDHLKRTDGALGGKSLGQVAAGL